MKFICPKCKSHFTIFENYIKCECGHTFDRAREGYYNLLMSNTGGTHGDNKEMLLARREFLNTGAYLSLAETVCELCKTYTDEGGLLLDCGCGEGYYTDIVAKGLTGCEVYAFDVSKDAVKMTAKRNKSILLAVASSYNMPFADESFDALLNVFSPLAREETHRVLKPHGKFIMALPDRRHLFGLKEKIYEHPYENEPSDTHLPGFRLLEERRISYEKEFRSSAEIGALFMMTPYVYRTKKEERERAMSLDYVKTEIEFIILVYEKI